MLQSVLLARLLGLSSYGVYIAIVSTITAVGLLVVCKVSEFIVREFNNAITSSDTQRAAAAVKFSYLLEGLSTLLVFLTCWTFAPELAKYLTHGAVSGDVVRVGCFIILANLFVDTSESLLKARGRFRIVFTGLLMRTNVAAVLVLVCFIWEIRNISVIIVFIVLSYSLRTVLLHVVALRELVRTIGLGWFRAPVFGRGWPLGVWFRYVLQNNLGGGLTVISKSGHVWLALLTSPEYVALFRVAESVGSLVYMPIRALSEASYPDLVGLVKRGDGGQLKRRLSSYSAIGSLVSAAACVVLAVSAPLLIPFLYGQEYGDAVGAAVVFMLGNVLCGAIYWAPFLVLAKGRPGVATIIKLITTLIQVPLMFVLLPSFYHVAAAALVGGGRVVQMALLAVSGLKISNVSR